MIWISLTGYRIFLEIGVHCVDPAAWHYGISNFTWWPRTMCFKIVEEFSSWLFIIGFKRGYKQAKDSFGRRHQFDLHSFKYRLETLKIINSLLKWPSTISHLRTRLSVVIACLYCFRSYNLSTSNNNKKNKEKKTGKENNIQNLQ